MNVPESYLLLSQVHGLFKWHLQHCTLIKLDTTLYLENHYLCVLLSSGRCAYACVFVVAVLAYTSSHTVDIAQALQQEVAMQNKKPCTQISAQNKKCMWCFKCTRGHDCVLLLICVGLIAMTGHSLQYTWYMSITELSRNRHILAESMIQKL
eukprot:scpid13564/ scgid25435/ 